ncbi:MAG TPA: DUF4907 domain-containing protein [Ginsengibacter sp.]
MTKKSYILLSALLLLVIVIIGFSSKPGKTDHKNMVLVESATFGVAGGWGYNILVDHKIFIHQDIIPAVQGNRAFASKEDAEKTSRLIIQKITSKKLPSVTKRELDSLQITY